MILLRDNLPKRQYEYQSRHFFGSINLKIFLVLEEWKNFRTKTQCVRNFVGRIRKIKFQFTFSFPSSVYFKKS